MQRSYSVKLLSDEDLIRGGCFDIKSVIKVCKEALIQYELGDIIFPHKVSVIFDENTQDRINCLPAAILPENIYGMKWISVFPQNPHQADKLNVSALTVLSELETGFPVAVIEASMATLLRTAAVGAIAASYLARKNSEIIGLIGAGEQAKAHLLSMKTVFPGLKICKVSSRTTKSERLFAEQMKRFYPDMEFITCDGNCREAVSDADIIVTAISGQEKVLQADWIADGAFYCHVAGLEDDFGVAQKATKIICDDWNTVKGRTQTISQMYKQGLLKDQDIYANLSDLILERKSGRENETEFIYFNSVGLSFIDIKVANWMYTKAVDAGLGKGFEIKGDCSLFDMPEYFMH